MLYSKCSNSVSWFRVPNCKVFVWKVCNGYRKWWLDKASSWCCRQDSKRFYVSWGHENASRRLNSLLQNLKQAKITLWHWAPHWTQLLTALRFHSISSKLLFSRAAWSWRFSFLDVISMIYTDYLLCPSYIPSHWCAQANTTHVQRSPQSAAPPHFC